MRHGSPCQQHRWHPLEPPRGLAPELQEHEMRDEYLRYGFYAKGIIPVVTKRDLLNQRVRRNIKNYAVGLGIPYRQWLEFLTDFYRDAPVIFVDAMGQEVFLDMSVFEDCASIDHWFRDFVVFAPEGKHVVIRKKAMGRVVVLGSLLAAHRSLRRKHP